jgi:hypothetical protein
VVPLAVEEVQWDVDNSGVHANSVDEWPTLEPEGMNQVLLEVPQVDPTFTTPEGPDIQSQQEDLWRIELQMSQADSGQDRGQRAFTTILDRVYQRMREGGPIPVKIEIGWKQDEQNRGMEWVQEQPC